MAGINRLSRVSDQRKALLRNQVTALIWEGRIETTQARAKEVRRIAEKLITKAKQGDSMAHRLVFAHLQHKDSVKKIVKEIAPKYANRNGGYTRIIKTRTRVGDAAPMAIIELV